MNKPKPMGAIKPNGKPVTYAEGARGQIEYADRKAEANARALEAQQKKGK